MVVQFGVNPTFDYSKESSRDILCIDCKSFYSLVECAERGLNPLKTKIVSTKSFLDVTDSLRLFGAKDANELARMIQIDVYQHTGIYTTVGIGDNPLLAKFALDLESKKILT